MRRLLLVPKTGLEPVRMLLRGILSPLRLPIPPHRQIFQIILLKNTCANILENTCTNYRAVNYALLNLPTKCCFSAVAQCCKHETAYGAGSAFFSKNVCFKISFTTNFNHRNRNILAFCIPSVNGCTNFTLCPV